MLETSGITNADQPSYAVAFTALFPSTKPPHWSMMYSMETPVMGMFDTSEPPWPLVAHAKCMANSV